MSKLAIFDCDGTLVDSGGTTTARSNRPLIATGSTARRVW